MTEDIFLEISATVPFFFNDTVNCIVSMCHMGNGRITEWWIEENVDEGSSCGLQKPKSNTASLWTTQTWSWSADYENANFSLSGNSNTFKATLTWSFTTTGLFHSIELWWNKITADWEETKNDNLTPTRN